MKIKSKILISVLFLLAFYNCTLFGQYPPSKDFFDSNIWNAQTPFAKKTPLWNSSICLIQDADTGCTVITLAGEIIKFDQFGSVVRINQPLSSGLYMRVFDAINTRDSCSLISGYLTDLQQIKYPFISKLSATRSVLWTKYNSLTSGVVSLQSVQNSDGSFYSVGSTLDSLGVNFITLIFKADSSGNNLWSKTMTLPFNCTSYDVLSIPNNELIITGLGGNSTYILKMDSAGSIVWSRSFIDQSYLGSAITLLSDGNYLMMSSVFGVTERIHLSKIDTSGNLIWSMSYSHLGNAIAPRQIIERVNRDIVCVGTIDYEYGFMLITDSTGMLKSSVRYSTDISNPITEIFNVFELTDESFMMLGRGNYNLYSAGFLSRTDSFGSGVCFAYPDSFSMLANNYILTPQTFNVSDFSTPTNSINFSNLFSVAADVDFCFSNFIPRNADVTVSIFPNPTKDHIIIKMEGVNEVASISICNSFGQIVFSKDFKEINSYELNINFNLPDGMYYGRINSTDKISSFVFSVSN